MSGRGLCDELITRPDESYRLCCVVVYDLETSRMGAPYIYIYIYIYIYDISRLRVNMHCSIFPISVTGAIIDIASTLISRRLQSIMLDIHLFLQP